MMKWKCQHHFWNARSLVVCVCGRAFDKQNIGNNEEEMTQSDHKSLVWFLHFFLIKD